MLRKFIRIIEGCALKAFIVRVLLHISQEKPLSELGDKGGERVPSCSLALPTEEGGCTSVLAMVQVSTWSLSLSSVATEEQTRSLANPLILTPSPNSNSGTGLVLGAPPSPRTCCCCCAARAAWCCIRWRGSRGLAGLRGGPAGECGLYHRCQGRPGHSSLGV